MPNSTLPPSFSRNGETLPPDSTPQAIIAVLIFLSATVLICFCTYCANLRNHIFNALFWRCRDDPKRGKMSVGHKYAFVPTDDIGFTNDGYTTSNATTPSPVYRNALIVGVPPYRKLTTLSTTFSVTADDNHHHGAGSSSGIVNHPDFCVAVNKDSVVSAV
uniref:Envelope glycoprotein UL132 n=1 Tax=Panagrellus redivivus TaxID=6233 RepID=A0A7E4VGF4_PANRE